MMDDYNKATIVAKDGKNVEMSVNWNDDKTVVALQIGSEKSVIKTDDLVKCLMLYGSQQNIQDLIPVKLTRVRKYETVLGFEWKASRDIKKGEKITINAPHVVTIPVEDEIFAGVLEKRLASKKSLYEIQRAVS